MKSFATAKTPAAPSHHSQGSQGSQKTFFRSACTGCEEKTPFFQTSLKVSSPGDRHEIEAEAMADHVTTQLDSSSTPFFSPSASGIQRKPFEDAPPEVSRVAQSEVARSAFESDQEIQRKADGEIEPEEKLEESGPALSRRASLQRSSASGKSLNCSSPPQRISRRALGSRSSAHLSRASWPANSPVPSAKISASRARGPPVAGSAFNQQLSSSKGSGQPLPSNTRGQMESAFGSDFSGVRVHTDQRAQTMSGQIQAQAFAHGQDIYFAENNYQPENRSGKHLLAHELTHVVQQGHGLQRSPTLSRAPPQIQRIPTSMEEVRQEVNDLAENVPGYSLATVLIGYNPILGQNVDWSAAAFFRGAAGLLPGGVHIYDKLNEGGAIDAAFAWIEGKITQYQLNLGRVSGLWDTAWEEMGVTEGIAGNIAIFRNTFSGFFSDVMSFIGDCIAKLTEILRDLAVAAVRALFGSDGPAYDLICMVLGQDPLTGESREWVTVDFLRSAMMLFGFGNHVAKMDETGQLQNAADWLDQQFGILSAAVIGLITGVTAIWDSLSLETLASPLETLTQTVNVVIGFVGKLIEFAGNVAIKILELVKEIIIGLLRTHAHRIPGYRLFTVVIGKDPVTGEEVPRTAMNFVHGFLQFVPDGEEIYANLEAGNAIGKAMDWLSAQAEELGLTPTAIVARVTELWGSFSIDDLMAPLPAFVRISEIFLGFVADVLTLAGRIALKLLEILFEVVMGSGGDRVLAILKQAQGTFNTIVEDPVAFVGNLVAAAKQGFIQFGSNILDHLINGLTGWLFGALEGAGIQIPAQFDLEGILSLVLQILGLTYAQIRPQLVEQLGEETVAHLESAFEVVRILVTEGLAGIWSRITEFITVSLPEMIIGGIQNFVMSTIVGAAITRIASMLNPAGAVIQAIIAIYNTIMFFIERMNQIITTVEAYVNSISKIASGDIGDAANAVENAMASTLPVIISFLARLIGLGGISDRIREIIQRIQTPIQAAIGRVIAWIVGQARRLGNALFGGGAANSEPEQASLNLTPDQAAQQVKERVDAKASDLAGLDNVRAATLMHTFYEQESQWVKNNVRSDGEEPSLKLIPHSDETTYWIEVSINPVYQSRAFAKPTTRGTAGSEGDQIGMFSGGHTALHTVTLNMNELRGAADNGSSLELGSGLYMTHFYADSKGYAEPVISNIDERNIGFINRLLIPRRLLRSAEGPQAPQTGVSDADRGLTGDVVSGEWKTLGNKDWRAGYQWCVRTQEALDNYVTVAEVYKPLEAADRFGRGRVTEYPSIFRSGGSAQPALVDARIQNIAAQRLNYGERPGPQTGVSTIQPKLKSGDELDQHERAADQGAQGYMAYHQSNCNASDQSLNSYGEYFGEDFSGVRIHHHARSAEMCDDYQARAFTHGNDIYFNRGEYDPGSRKGQNLLAHELTHVVQQNSGQASTPQAKLKEAPAPAEEKKPAAVLPGNTQGRAPPEQEKEPIAATTEQAAPAEAKHPQPGNQSAAPAAASPVVEAPAESDSAVLPPVTALAAEQNVPVGEDLTTEPASSSDLHISEITSLEPCSERAEALTHISVLDQDFEKSKANIIAMADLQRQIVAAQFSQAHTALSQQVESRIASVQQLIFNQQASLQIHADLVLSSVQSTVLTTMDSGTVVAENMATSVSAFVGQISDSISASTSSVNQRVISMAESASLPDLPGVETVRSLMVGGLQSAAGMVKSALSGITESISNALDTALEVIRRATSVFSGLVDQIFSKLRLGVQSALTNVVGILHRIIQYIGASLRSALASTLFPLLNQAERSQLGQIQQLQRSAIAELQENRSQAIAAIHSLLIPPPDAVPPAGDANAESFDPLLEIRLISRRAMTGNLLIVSKTQQKLNEQGFSVTAVLQSAVGQVISKIQQAIADIAAQVSGLISSVIHQISAMAEWTRQQVSQVLSGLQQILTDVIRSLRDGISSPAQEFIALVSGVVASASSMISQAIQSFMSGGGLLDSNSYFLPLMPPRIRYAPPDPEVIIGIVLEVLIELLVYILIAAILIALGMLALLLIVIVLAIIALFIFVLWKLTKPSPAPVPVPAPKPIPKPTPRPRPGPKPEPDPGKCRCAEPIDIAPGMSVAFPKRPSARERVGKVISVFCSSVSKEWYIQYRPFYNPGTTLITTLAYDAACKPLYVIPGKCQITFPTIKTLAVPARAESPAARIKSSEVLAVPLCWDHYQAPSGELVGRDRIANKGSWPRAHLVNGRWGGPGVAWNLVPVPRTVNNGSMPAAYEIALTNLITAGKMSGKFYWFRARVSYNSETGNPPLGHFDDFATSIAVSYGEAVASGSTWTLLPGITSGVTIPSGRPNSSELISGRLSG